VLGSPVADLARAAEELVVVWSQALYRAGEVNGLSSYITARQQKAPAPIGAKARFRQHAGSHLNGFPRETRAAQ
jgi:hypothetical protein